MKTAVIVIPTYNEQGNIEELLHQLFDVFQSISNWNMEILVVDSKSKDKTEDIVKSLQKKHKNLHLLVTEKEGLGKAYLNGFQYALDTLKAYVLFEMDADLSHDPKEIPTFLKEIEKGADFVIGSRYMKGGSIPSNWGLRRIVYSTLANYYIRFGFMKPKITEWTNGYRAIKAWLVKEAIPYQKDYTGYVFQVAFLDFALRQNARIAQIPNKFVDRTIGKSKIDTTEYIFQTILYVFTHSSFIKFAIVGVIGALLDFGVSHLLIKDPKKALWFATAISAECAIIFNFIANNFWSFAHKKIEHSHTNYIFNFLKFNLISSGSLIIQAVGIQLAGNYFGRDLWWLYKIIIIIFIIIPYSYLLYNKFIWKDKKN